MIRSILKAVPLIVATAGVIASPDLVLAQGRGIGRSVSALARSGVHGPQLAARIQQLQALNGIGQVNGLRRGGGGPGFGGGLAPGADPGLSKKGAGGPAGGGAMRGPGAPGGPGKGHPGKGMSGAGLGMGLGGAMAGAAGFGGAGKGPPGLAHGKGHAVGGAGMGGPGGMKHGKGRSGP